MIQINESSTKLLNGVTSATYRSLNAPSSDLLANLVTFVENNTNLRFSELVLQKIIKINLKDRRKTTKGPSVPGYIYIYIYSYFPPNGYFSCQSSSRLTRGKMDG